MWKTAFRHICEDCGDNPSVGLTSEHFECFVNDLPLHTVEGRYCTDAELRQFLIRTLSAPDEWTAQGLRSSQSQETTTASSSSGLQTTEGGRREAMPPLPVDAATGGSTGGSSD